MKFVNEVMNEEEIKVATEQMMQNSQNGQMKLNTNRWVINRDEKVFLLWVYAESNPPYDNYFVFGWKDSYMLVKFQKVCTDDNICTWELIYIGIKEELLSQRKEISKSLRNAILCFGIDGTSDLQGKEIIANLNF